MSFPYIDISESVRQIMAGISVCRDQDCLVVNRHPFYPTPDTPPFYYGQRPCMPVVPTHLRSNRVMIIGQYPNCRYGYFDPSQGSPERFIPVADINEPFEGGRYFDGYSVRDYPTEVSLESYYLEPLGLSLQDDVWLTNVVKCYLLKDSNVRDYQDIAWTSPSVEATYDDYLDVASVCVSKHLVREVQECGPQMIIGLGERVYRMLHCSAQFQPGPDITFRNIVGVPLLAGQQTHNLDQRHPIFQDINVIHLYHPSFLARQATTTILEEHLNQHIPEARKLLTSASLP